MGEKIDIIIPCYNPIGKWEENLVSSYKELNKSADEFNFIVVNDGSTSPPTTDQIKFISDNIANFTYHTYGLNKGKGYAVRYGMKKATNNISIFTDIDFPYGTTPILEMVERIRSGYDLVLALRDNSYYNNISPTRKLISKTLMKTIKILFRVPFSDTQGGLKGLSLTGRDILINTSIDRYLFDLELVKLSHKNKLKISGIVCKLKPGIELSNVGLIILYKEFVNFIKIILM